MPFGLSKVLSPAAIRREMKRGKSRVESCGSFAGDAACRAWQLLAKTKKPADIAAAGFTNRRDTSAGRSKPHQELAFKALDQAA